MGTVARHLIIHGRVQGVWYRAWTVRTAQGLGLTGWVRNLRGGDVEALVQGEESAVDAFVTEAWRGPPAANVTAIEAQDVPISDIARFEQRDTA